MGAVPGFLTYSFTFLSFLYIHTPLIHDEPGALRHLSCLLHLQIGLFLVANKYSCMLVYQVKLAASRQVILQSILEIEVTSVNNFAGT